MDALANWGETTKSTISKSCLIEMLIISRHSCRFLLVVKKMTSIVIYEYKIYMNWTLEQDVVGLKLLD